MNWVIVLARFAVLSRSELFTFYQYNALRTLKFFPEKKPILLTFKQQNHKIVKHTQTIRRQKPTNCLSVFGHFVGLALKELHCQVQESMILIHARSPTNILDFCRTVYIRELFIYLFIYLFRYLFMISLIYLLFFSSYFCKNLRLQLINEYTKMKQDSYQTH